MGFDDQTGGRWLEPWAGGWVLLHCSRWMHGQWLLLDGRQQLSLLPRATLGSFIHSSIQLCATLVPDWDWALGPRDESHPGLTLMGLPDQGQDRHTEPGTTLAYPCRAQAGGPWPSLGVVRKGFQEEAESEPKPVR